MQLGVEIGKIVSIVKIHAAGSISLVIMLSCTLDNGILSSHHGLELVHISLSHWVVES